jgi:hypothetical protein
MNDSVPAHMTRTAHTVQVPKGELGLTLAIGDCYLFKPNCHSFKTITKPTARG